MLLQGQNRALRKENKRLESNSKTLLSQINVYSNSLGQSVAHVGKLELKISELEKHNARLALAVEQMGIKLRRAQSLSLTSIKNELTFSQPLVTHIQPSGQMIKRFSWSNPWNSVHGDIRNDSVSCKVIHRDTLNQVVYRVPHKFLFFRWGTKAIRQAVSLADTSSTIVYSEYIVLKKSK